MMLSVLMWLAMQGQVQGTPNPEIGPLICNYCGQLDDGSGHANLTAEHVIEIKTVRDDKKAAVGVEKPAPFPCNVNDGPYLTCTTSSVIHWSCADKDHQLAGGFDELLYIDPKHPNNPYCERVTRELWIDGVRWGVVKGLE